MGYVLGLAGVLVFSLTLPATRLTVGFLSPAFVGLGRAAVAGVLALAVLLFTRSFRFGWMVWRQLALVSLGIVFGFPLLTTLALQHLPASHGAVVIGLLPLGTAWAGAWLNHERHSRSFWLAGMLGSAVVVVYSLFRGGWVLGAEDGYLVGAVVLASYGYAEGARLSRVWGGWRVVSGSLVVALPITLIVAVVTWPPAAEVVPWSAWLGFAYTVLFSMFLGFFVWYAGLARGGIGKVGQLQLLQPFLTLAVSVLFLGEALDPWTPVVATIVVGLVFLGRRSKPLA